MLTFENILEQIEAAISRISFEIPPRSLFTPIEYTLALGGKRIRPALTLMACNLFSENIDKAINPALGIEIFHNFTLLHDDLMDGADKRRGYPTVHKKWNANTAILSGDAMLIAAYQFVVETDKEYLKEVLDLFSETAMEICAGQQYDMEFETRTDVQVEEYMEMIRLKTAVLLACSLKTGAIVGGASEADANRLYGFGLYIGLAFQLQDDLLDVYGDPATFGKNIGGDILCNKKTFLLLTAYERASYEQRQQLDNWTSQTETPVPQDKIDAVTAIYNQLDLKRLSEKKMAYYYKLALESLSALSIPPDRTEVLRDLAEKMMYRKS